MNIGDVMPALLVLLFVSALSIGAGLVIFVLRLLRRNRDQRKFSHQISFDGFLPAQPTWVRRPPCWLAIKNRNVLAVQSSLGLHNPKPCSWSEGLAGEQKLFIAPPVKGWILVIGSGLPDPSEDVDACFRFLLDLSRKLGHVQFFSASQVLQQHAWVRLEAGRVLRAYAWAGKTIWKQGLRTAAELELGMKCLDYAQSVEGASFALSEVMAANADKVPLLAARWSLDPAEIDERFFEHERGIAGESSRRY
jgi:hypothetical protein